MSLLEKPKPPYYAVIFTSIRTPVANGYKETAERMAELASQQPGYLGHESAREEVGITVSYWRSMEDIKNWKSHAAHIIAQEKGKNEWYSEYSVKICKVEHTYDFKNP